jgi:hypothetical protein
MWSGWSPVVVDFHLMIKHFKLSDWNSFIRLKCLLLVDLWTIITTQ